MGARKSGRGKAAQTSGTEARARKAPPSSEVAPKSKTAGTAAPSHACHELVPPPDRGELLPHPSVPRARLARRGKPVTVVIDASGAGRGHRYVRADIELHGLDHSGATYEGRIFLNNARATARTPLDPKEGYAGHFYVFGHGQCFGDDGHCDVPTEYAKGDRRRPHPLDPIVRRVTATEAVRVAASKARKLKVTIVPVLQAATTQCDLDDVVKFERLQLVTYNS